MKILSKISLGCFLVMPLLASPAHAMLDCDPKYTFEYNIEHADIVFEGYLAEPEIREVPDYDGTYVLILHEMVEKNWKGTKVGEEVSLMSPTSFGKEDIPFMESTFPEMIRLGRIARIFALRGDNDGNPGYIYSADCESDHYEATPERLKILKDKFPEVPL